MGKSIYCDENGLKKGAWSAAEDQKLVEHIQKHGVGSWSSLPKLAGLNRCGKSCRLRWTNYLRPNIKRGHFTPEEEQTILHLHSILGNKWSIIASRLPGRTDNGIKNYWNTNLKKKLIRMGIDPVTHQPQTDDMFVSFPQLLTLSNLKDLIPPHPFSEIVHLAKLQYIQQLLQLHAASTSVTVSPYCNSPLTYTAHHDSSYTDPPNSKIGSYFDPKGLVSPSPEISGITTYSHELLQSQPYNLQDPEVPFIFQPALNTEEISEGVTNVGRLDA